MGNSETLFNYLDWEDPSFQSLVTKYIAEAPKMYPNPDEWVGNYVRDFPVVENRPLAVMQLDMFSDNEPLGGIYKCDLGKFQIHTEIETFSKEVDKYVSENKFVSIDIETSGLDIYKDVIRTVQITNDGRFSHVLLCEKLGYLCKEPLAKLLRSCPLVFQNGVFDVSFLMMFTGVFPKAIVFDTLIAAQNLDAGYYNKTDRAFNLGSLSKRYLNLKLDKSQQSTFGKHSNLPLTMEQLEYAANDTLATWRLAPVLAKRIEDCNLKHTFIDLDMACMAPVIDLKIRGCPIDINHVLELEKQFGPKIEILEKELNTLMGLTSDVLKNSLTEENQDLVLTSASIFETKKKPAFNKRGKVTDLKSSQKVLEAFHRLGYTDLESTGEGTLGTYFLKRPCRKLSDEDIEEVEKICKPAGLLLKHRDAVKKMDAFILSYKNKYYNPKTGCLHPSLNISGSLSEENSRDGKDVATGRFSSSNPNIQQMDASQLFRDIFKAPEGFMYVKVDASQQEVRVMAEVSKDDNLSNIYINEGNVPADIYSEIARKVTKLTTIPKKTRQLYKAIVLGTGYGSGPGTIAEVAGISMDQAKKAILDYFKSFPGVKEYIKTSELEARTNGFIANKASGRRRYWNHARIAEDNKSYLYKTQSGNYGIQSYAADCGKKAFLLAYKRCAEIGARVLFPVHDKILVVVKPL